MTKRRTRSSATATVKKSTPVVTSHVVRVNKVTQPRVIMTESTTASKIRPEKPNLSLEDYKADFKVRWQIHTYEVNELGSDIKKGYEYVLPIVKKVVNYSTETYKNLQTRFATVD